MCSSTSAFSASSSAASQISPNPTCGSTGGAALGSVANSRVQSKLGERQNRRRRRRSSERSCTWSAKLKSGLRIVSMGEFRPGTRSSHCSRISEGVVYKYIYIQTSGVSENGNKTQVIVVLRGCEQMAVERAVATRLQGFSHCIPIRRGPKKLTPIA